MAVDNTIRNYFDLLRSMNGVTELLLVRDDAIKEDKKVSSTPPSNDQEEEDDDDDEEEEIPQIVLIRYKGSPPRRPCRKPSFDRLANILRLPGVDTADDGLPDMPGRKPSLNNLLLFRNNRNSKSRDRLLKKLSSDYLRKTAAAARTNKNKKKNKNKNRLTTMMNFYDEVKPGCGKQVATRTRYSNDYNCSSFSIGTRSNTPFEISKQDPCSRWNAITITTTTPTAKRRVSN